MNSVTEIKTVVLRNVASMWRRRWPAIGVAWLVCVAGWGYVAYLPDSYEAKARIQVNTDSLLRPLMRGLAANTDVRNEVALLQQTLLSRPNLIKVSHMADLDLTAKTAAAQDALITDLEHQIRVTNQGSSLFAITYSAETPAKAKKVVQSLLDVLVESNLGNSRKEMVTATDFIDNQLQEYRQELDKADQRIAEFKARHIEVLGGKNGNVSGLEGAQTERDQTLGQLADARRKRDELKRQLAAVPRFIEIVNAGGFGPPLGPPVGASQDGSVGSVALAENRVAQLQQKLDALRLRYTDQHPDVIETKRLLGNAKADLKTAEQKRRAAETHDSAQPQTTKSTIPNPIYDKLKLQLVDEEANIATLESRLDRDQQNVRKWEVRAKAVPALAAQLAELTRNDGVIRRNYNELLARQQSAKIGQSMAAQTRNVQFRLIDPPDAPATPSGPNRPLFMSVAFVVGLGAGLAFALFLAQLDNSIRDISQLRTEFGLPVLGAISAVRSAGERRRRMLAGLAYGATCLILAGAYAGLLTANLVFPQGI